MTRGAGRHCQTVVRLRRTAAAPPGAPAPGLSFGRRLVRPSRPGGRTLSAGAPAHPTPVAADRRASADRGLAPFAVRRCETGWNASTGSPRGGAFSHPATAAERVRPSLVVSARRSAWCCQIGDARRSIVSERRPREAAARVDPVPALSGVGEAGVAQWQSGAPAARIPAPPRRSLLPLEFVT